VLFLAAIFCFDRGEQFWVGVFNKGVAVEHGSGASVGNSKINSNI
jgi:hypothetical protein